MSSSHKVKRQVIYIYMVKCRLIHKRNDHLSSSMTEDQPKKAQIPHINQKHEKTSIVGIAGQ